MVDAIIPGAINYLSASKYANKTGNAAQNLSLTDTMTTNLLDAGRLNTGIGLSARARQLNSQFVSSAASYGETIFSSSLSGLTTNEELLQKINAIRAHLPQSQLAENLRDDGSIDASTTSGTNVDTSA